MPVGCRASLRTDGVYVSRANYAMSKNKSRAYCAVHQCTSQRLNDKLSFFKLPSDEERIAAVNNSTTTLNTGTTLRLKSYDDIPGPSSLPVIGPLLHLLPGGNLAGCKGIKLFERLHQLYGQDGIVRVGSIVSAPDMVFLYDPDAIEYVLRSENQLPVRPGFASLEYYRHRHNKVFDPKRQTGLLTDHGENWRDFRTKVNQILMQTKTIKLYTDVLEEVANDMIKRMRSLRDKNNMIKTKLVDAMNLWAVESVGVVALGTRLNCFDPNLPEDSPARKLIKNIHGFLVVSQKLDYGFTSPWRLFPTPTFKKAMKLYEELEQLTKHYIDQALKNIEEAKKGLRQTSDSQKGVLEKLLEIDVRVAQIMASDMLLAGVDTSVNTALPTLYLLATNPEKQNKLRAEIISKEPRKSYLKACIKESLRVMPVVTGNLRQTTKECDLLGYRIPKNTLIALSHQYLSVMEKYYPKPGEFIPERWLAEKNDPIYYGNAHPFVTSPFGYGVRSCIGQRIASLEMEILISKAIENFQIEWTGEPIQVTNKTINYTTGPFNFVFKEL